MEETRPEKYRENSKEDKDQNELRLFTVQR